jgi:hypothetical protein
MAVLYWLKAVEHTDMWSQGYVGVTSHIEKRLRSHKHRFKAMWDKIVFQKLVIADKRYCYDLEKKFRPFRNIGWNKSMGGYRLNAMNGKDNPNFGKIGQEAPNFIGWYITPLGKFARPEDAAVQHKCSLSTIARRCKGRYVNGKYLQPQKGYAFEQKVAG